MMHSTYNPVSTYRIQFNPEFTFDDAKKIIAYLRKSGIRTLYASPVFGAARDSQHGYDVTDPHHLNAQIGTGKAHAALMGKLRSAGMGWIQDVVPNHMAYSPENPWVFDLLSKGPASPYYTYFDLIPPEENPDLHGKLTLPFLGDSLEETIEKKALHLNFGEKGFLINYYDTGYPVSESSCDYILEQVHHCAPELAREIRTILADTIGRPDERIRKLYSFYQADQDFRDHADRCMSMINNDPVLMSSLVDQQHYLPSHWQETEQRMSYRRFFSINGLICLNIQNQQVFGDYHQLVAKWIDEGVIQGLRIDHIDGLNDPAGYLEHIRTMGGDNLYVVVEKILEEDEMLPDGWPVQGTTGYDFLALVNNLLTNDSTEVDFHEYLEEWTDMPEDYATLAIRKKRFFLENRFRGELEHLLHQCRSTGAPALADLNDDDLRSAIASFLVYCPVYRIYSVPSTFTPADRQLIRQIFAESCKADPDHRTSLSVLETLFINDQVSEDAPAPVESAQDSGESATDFGESAQASGPGAQDSEENDQDAEEEELIFDPNEQEQEFSSGQRQAIDAFFRRCMQFTGPIMAKGIEDTLFYSYNPFLAHNEVGDSPGFFGIRREKFHAAMKYRIAHWPMAMNTTSTHDTKRGEDARARLNVLSDLPAKWMEITRSWREINRPARSKAGSMLVPSRNDEYFIYQSLVAHLPMDGNIDNDFRGRFREFMVKALREAKQNTSWSDPQEAYEKGTLAFIDSILTLDNGFLESLSRFTGEIKTHGMINSLVQLILKHTVPGVPDTFQGNETWNLDFVDPDNRRPVDYSKLSRHLNSMLKEAEKGKKELLLKLWDAPENGRIKQWIHHLLLHERDAHETLFLKGQYTPLEVKGDAKDHVIAFHRQYKDEHLLVILPLNLAALSGPGAWKKTRVVLPELSPLHWSSLFSGETHAYNGSIRISELFETFPMAVLKGEQRGPARKSGILMHISSLPGDFGIGDFGPGATQFIDFLKRTGQRYWQILPLSVAEKATSYSPYSSASAFAGNELFIDPYRLVRDGLLDARSLQKRKRKAKNRVKFKAAARAKHAFIGEAFKTFRAGRNEQLIKKYHVFLEQEKYWLDDFVLFSCLRDQFSNQPWNKWPAEYRDRDPQTLDSFLKLYDEELDALRFTQFLFSLHWMETKEYANDRGIEIFGDIPIYVDFNSADVWAHQELFKLDKQGEMTAVAGVPPDYFNQEGQHWGMPLFDWKTMEKNGFSWWLKRIEKNLQWFDLLRLDHFRGFSAYWDIPAGADSAIHGTWKPGPGKKLLNAIQKEFPGMPFVAEDLGMIDQDVYDLRDHYQLPGMKVVQFGFGSNMPESEHNPLNINHNSIVYSGTHDNNTIKGWYRKEADKATLKRIRKFHGKKLNGKNAHLEMIRIAYGTQAKMVIIPMQDWLGLDERSRMNFPSTTSGNWNWKLPALPQADGLEKEIIGYGKTFGRF